MVAVTEAGEQSAVYIDSSGGERTRYRVRREDSPGEPLRIKLTREGKPANLSDVQRASLIVSEWYNEVYSRRMDVADEEAAILTYQLEQRDTDLEPGTYHATVELRRSYGATETYPNTSPLKFVISR